MDGFEEELEKQRELSREGARTIEVGFSIPIEFTSTTSFVGYSDNKAKAKIQNIFVEGKDIDEFTEGTQGYIILDKTPFYAESGGQIGDEGYLVGGRGKAKVLNTTKSNSMIYHHAVGEEGSLKKGEEIEAIVDLERRRSIMRNHTATHLLHKALRETLGEHVHQAGSSVEPKSFRFDFTHFKALTEKELEQIEEKVNEKILENLKVKTFNASLEEAKKLGAMALFGEKYEDTVRVVKVDEYSMELCGGTHVKATGEIGMFRIISEQSIAAGMRRIEAITGKSAYELVKEEEKTLEGLSDILKVKREELGTKVAELLENSREMEKKVKHAQAGSAKEKIRELYEKGLELDGVRIISYKEENGSREGLLSLADALRENLKSSVGVFATVSDDKVSFVAAVTDDLVKKGIKAGELIKEVAKLTGGSGGGKSHLAQAGGKDITKLDFALSKVPEIIKKMLSGAH
jgi:alanyl-tRNA synthetase